MKILILVCSSHQPPYDSFMKAQKETWDSIIHPNIETVFYHGSGDNTWEGNVYRSDCAHGYYTQHWKHKQAIDACWEKDWDIVFRTHSSSYVDKEKLYEFAKDLPTEKTYGGWKLGEGMDSIIWNGHEILQECISGAGIFYSRDIADILRKNIPEGQNIEEDVLSGRILQTFGIRPSFDDRSRQDIQGPWGTRDSYHYRIKTADRRQDINTMYLLHKLKTGKGEWKI